MQQQEQHPFRSVSGRRKYFTHTKETKTIKKKNKCVMREKTYRKKSTYTHAPAHHIDGEATTTATLGGEYPFCMCKAIASAQNNHKITPTIHTTETETIFPVTVRPGVLHFQKEYVSSVSGEITYVRHTNNETKESPSPGGGAMTCMSPTKATTTCSCTNTRSLGCWPPSPTPILHHVHLIHFNDEVRSKNIKISYAGANHRRRD